MVTRRTAVILAASIGLLFAPPLNGEAAPIWVERNFVPKAELVDPDFVVSDEASTEVIDHSAWGAFLSAYLVQSPDGVNKIRYSAVSEDDAAALNAYIKSLEAVKIEQLASDEQLAFWINLYNAATIRLILENYPLDSIQDIDDPWDTPVTTVSGRAFTLNEIEHGVIRPVFKDNRIHYAVNCASIGCPNLSIKAYTGENVDTMLDDAARAYVMHPRGVRTDGRRVIASKIYGWYQEDFGENSAAVLDHIRQYAEGDKLDALKGKRRINRYEYDWALNEAAQ